MKKMQNIVAIEQDGLDTRVMVIPCEILSDNPKFDLTDAAKKAAAHYLKTEEGQLVYEYNNACFNWGDFAAEVPNEICMIHGFRKEKESINNIVCDWNEQLDDLFLSEIA